MRILRDNTSALIIDIQERLYPHIHNHKALAERCGVLINGLQALDIPVHLTQQYTRGLGETIGEISSLFEPFHAIEKTAFSCCDEPGVIMALERTGRECVLLAGIETHVCVLQTCIDLVERGFRPVVVEDCVSSRNSADKECALKRMRQEGGIITSCESVLFELCRYSGTPEFKTISALVK